MKIASYNNILNNSFLNSKKVSFNNQSTKHNSYNSHQKSNAMLNASYILSYCGGKSLNLSQTQKQIERFGKFPPDIKENITKELETGNLENKTLVDIHKEKYSSLNDLDTIEEARFFFNEFKGVLSDSQIKYNKNSFIDKVKKGEIEYFDPDVDVALQLLQMHWADGFSINELKYLINQDIDYAFKALKIPKMDKVYMRYLQLSDKKYNENYTQKLSQRLKEASKLRKSKRQNETFDNESQIKTGVLNSSKKRAPLSDEHKKKISQSLIKYYEEHKKEVLEVSDEFLDKIEKSPQEKEIFSQVMLRAWKYPETKSVRKAMSKYMKKDITDEEIMGITQRNSQIRKNLKGFYEKNKWAKEQLSKAMVKSWARQKELEEMGLVYEPCGNIEIFPSKIAKEIERNTKIPNLARNLNFYIVDTKEEQFNEELLAVADKKGKEAFKIAKSYLDEHENLKKKLKDTIYFGLVEMADALWQINKYDVAEVVINIIKEEESLTLEEFIKFYVEIMAGISPICPLDFSKELLDIYYERFIDGAEDKVIENRKKQAKRTLLNLKKA